MLNSSPNVISGAPINTVASGVQGATVAGGGFNPSLFFGGSRSGGPNSISADLGTISGGGNNRVSGQFGTVAGGVSNQATDQYATVAGGKTNTAAGEGSFAGGGGANAAHAGAFVWMDDSWITGAYFSFSSEAENEFAALATGGIRFVTAASANLDRSANPTAGVQVSAGSGAWSSLSDRNSKENFAPLDTRTLLNRLAEIPMQTWNYKTQTATIRHIGPMAQDFYAAFNVGEDDKHITTIDADGVSLAAIQGLYKLAQDQQPQIEVLKATVESCVRKP